MAKGQLVGYIRVSTEEQNTARQQEALADFNLDKTFTDKASGKDTERPQLQAALAQPPLESCFAQDEDRHLVEQVCDVRPPYL